MAERRDASPLERPRQRLAHLLFAGFCLTALAGLIWPAYAWLGNRVKPYILGLPFSMAWIVGWILASFVALVLYERALRRDLALRPGLARGSSHPK